MVMRKSYISIRCGHLPVYFADQYEGLNILVANDHLFEGEIFTNIFSSFKMAAITKNSKTNKIVIFSRMARYIWLKFCMKY